MACAGACKCNRTSFPSRPMSVLLQQVELASELQSDLRDTVDWARGSGLLISMLQKLSLFYLALVLLMGKRMGLFLKESLLWDDFLDVEIVFLF